MYFLDKTVLNTCKSPPLRRSAHMPTPSSAGSLQNRIKQRLQKNALVQSPTLSEQKKELQEQMILKAQRDAQALCDQVSDTDIGPFFGLPSKEHRGIKKLYGKKKNMYFRHSMRKTFQDFTWCTSVNKLKVLEMPKDLHVEPLSPKCVKKIL